VIDIRDGVVYRPHTAGNQSPGFLNAHSVDRISAASLAMPNNLALAFSPAPSENRPIWAQITTRPFTCGGWAGDGVGAWATGSAVAAGFGTALVLGRDALIALGARLAELAI
jgi:hypothetical protein